MGTMIIVLKGFFLVVVLILGFFIFTNKDINKTYLLLQICFCIIFTITSYENYLKKNTKWFYLYFLGALMFLFFSISIYYKQRM